MIHVSRNQSHAFGQLFLIADIPTLGLDRIVSVLRDALPLLPSGRVTVVDRDMPPDMGGTRVKARLAHLDRLRALTTTHGARLVVSARFDLAHAVGADGVQLPERGLPAADARACFPDDLIGRSCHDAAGLEAAEQAGADWAFLSPVYPPLSKQVTTPTLGLDGFARLVEGRALPIIALGGIRAHRARALLDAGASGFAMLGGFFLARDLPREARHLAAVWEGI